MEALWPATRSPKYIGVFTKVVGFDKTKPSPPGTGGRHGRTPPVLVVVKRADAPVGFSNYLAVCTSSKFSLIAPDFALKV